MYYKSDKVSHDEKRREEGREIQKVRNMEHKHNVPLKQTKYENYV
jgi:hypothetical protein